MLYAVARQHVELGPAHLRAAELKGVALSMITPNESQVLTPLRNRVSIVAQWLAFRLSESARAGRLSRNDLRLIEGRLSDFVRAWSGAERLVSTPMPYPFVQVLNALLLAYVWSAPFTFAHRFGGFTPVASALLAFALLGMNAAAAEVEHPFGTRANDLPLSYLAAVLEEDSEMILRQRDPDTEKYEKFWGKRALNQRLLREGEAPGSGAADGARGIQGFGMRGGPPKVGVAQQAVTVTPR
jgi:predicted membrane chloride channel (bestrophin family)